MNLFLVGFSYFEPLCFTSQQLLPTLLRRESFLLSNSGGLLFRWSPRAITNIIGSPQLCYCRRWTLSSLCRNDSWTPISSSMRTYLHDNCLKPISFLLRLVCLFGLLLFKQLHAVGRKPIALSSLQNAETTPERPFLPQCVHTYDSTSQTYWV